MIEEIASQRVAQVNNLIEAYHRKSEIALNMMPPPNVPKNEKLSEIQENLNSYDSVRYLAAVPPYEEIK